MKKTEKIASIIVILIGSLSMVGALIQLDLLKGIGIMSNASPLPLVFSKFRGVENFSSDYFMKVAFDDGEVKHFQVTPEMYNRAKGPYNRRNPYGAVLAYGPMLDKPNEIVLRNEIMEYASCGEGSFMREIGIEKPIARIDVTIKSKTVAKPEWVFSVDCSRTKI